MKRREAGVGWLSLASSLMKDPVWLAASAPLPIRPPPAVSLWRARPARPHGGAGASLSVPRLMRVHGKQAYRYNQACRNLLLLSITLSRYLCTGSLNASSIVMPTYHVFPPSVNLEKYAKSIKRPYWH